MAVNEATIIHDGDTFRYFDRNGVELYDGDSVLIDGEAMLDGNSKVMRLYETEDGELGVDATNPAWLEKGYPPCSFGIYPISVDTLAHAVKVVSEGGDI